MEKSVHTSEYASLLAVIRRLRDEAGLSQRDLAAKLNVAPSWVAKVEGGERRLDVVEFYWLVSACRGDAAAILESLCGQFARRRKSDRTKGASSP
jgi:transcriptional regulator with XRE-family HTH domain